MRDKGKVQIVPGAWFLGAVGAMVVLDRVAPGVRPVPAPYRYAGGLLVLAGIAAGIWAVWLFQRSRTTPRPDKTPAVLVVRGPYRISRHPMYLGLTVALCGAAVLLGSLTPWAVAVAFFAFVARPSAIEEEQVMDAAFGEAYGRYKGRVRRWL